MEIQEKEQEIRQLRLDELEALMDKAIKDRWDLYEPNPESDKSEPNKSQFIRVAMIRELIRNKMAFGEGFEGKQCSFRLAGKVISYYGNALLEQATDAVIKRGKYPNRLCFMVAAICNELARAEIIPKQWVITDEQTRGYSPERVM